jgi:predicted MPP superfamily phosphohydrolase
MGHSLWYALPVACLILVYGYINYKHPRVEEIKVTTARKTEGQTLRIVAVSDVHLGYGTGVSALQKYVDLINAQQPDVVLIAGDLIDNSIQPLIGKPFDKVLAQIHAPQGIYMVPGNHEYISDVNKVKQYLKQTPITLLQDSIVTLPGGIQLLGRDDRSNKHRQPLSWLLERTDRSRPVIVLDHQPYHLAQADSLQVDLMICGHTHRGQVWPASLLTDKMYKQSYGYRKWNHSHIFVSSGLSLWGPPFRIGTRSEIVVFNLATARN